MFAYIKGILEESDNHRVVIDVQGIGYSIIVPSSLLTRLPAKGLMVKLYTYFQVREDSQELYGFLEKEEKLFFEKLISVSGIGPKVAIGMLSAFSSNQLALAIITGDDKSLSAAPGIGKKTAQRLILELKDKIDHETVEMKGAFRPAAAVFGEKSEVLEALIALGYQATDAQRALAGVDDESDDPSVLIKLALKNLDRRR